MTDKKTKGQSIHKHNGPDHSSPYPVSRLAPPIQLVDLARQIEQADKMLATQISSKLKIISDQIMKLQDEARHVLEKAKQDQELHRVKCNFKPVPEQIYHLYAKKDNSRYFSMLSPGDWQGKPPDTYLGSYRLEEDMSWTMQENLEEKDRFNEKLTDYLKNQS